MSKSILNAPRAIVPSLPLILPQDAKNSPVGDMESEDRAPGDSRPSAPEDRADAPSRGLPDWAPFDPGETPELQDPESGFGRVVGVVAATELVDAGWALSATIALARAWADRRPGAVLVDTNFSRPRMHRFVGVDNTVGLAEVLRGDAPASRATRVVERDRLFCVPAGNTPGAIDGSFDADRWERFCRAFAEAGVTVIAYVPAGAPWAGLVLGQATDVVELRAEDAPLDIVLPDGVAVLAALGPMPRGRRPIDREEEPIDPTDETASAPLPEPATVPAVPTALASPDRKGRDRRRRRTLLAMGIAAGVLAVAVGLRAVMVTTETPALGPEAEALPVVPSEARPIPPELRFSVAVGSYRDRDRAENRIAELAVAVPQVAWWYVSPVQVEGTVYQRILGGFAPDSASAVVLASRLVETLGLDEDGWVVRDTDVVIDFGEAPDRTEAEAEVVRLRARGVPAYAVRVEYSDRTYRHRIYAGGYADPEEASYLLASVAALGVDAAVAPRMGAAAP